MSHLWNPFAFTMLGEPVGPQAPVALRAVGGELTVEQAALARETFFRFTMHSRLSQVPNPVEGGQLADGSQYKITVVGNTTTMQVWPVKASERKEFVGESGIMVVASGQQYLLQNDGGWAAPAASWTVTQVSNYLHGGNMWLTSFNFGPLLDRRAFWHSRSGPTYLLRDGYRRGVRVVESGVVTPGGPGAQTLVDEGDSALRKFIRVDYVGGPVTATYFAWKDITPEPPPATPATLDLLYSETIYTASAEGMRVARVVLHPTGDKVLVGVELANNVPAPVYNTDLGLWVWAFPFASVGSSVFERIELASERRAYEFDRKNTWARTVRRSGVPAYQVDPVPEIRAYYPDMYAPGSSARIYDIRGHTTSVPIITPFNREPHNCSLPQELNVKWSETSGVLAYSERSLADTGRFLGMPGSPGEVNSRIGGPTYSFNGTLSITDSRLVRRFAADSSTTRTGETFVTKGCDIFGSPFSQPSHWWTTNDGSVDVENRETWYAYPNDEEFILSHRKYVEHGTGTESITSTDGGNNGTTSWTSSTTYSFESVQRAVVLYDPFHELLVYTEVEYSYDREIKLEHDTTITQGEQTITKSRLTLSGGVTALPTMYLVIRRKGAEQRTPITVPSNEVERRLHALGVTTANLIDDPYVRGSSEAPPSLPGSFLGAPRLGNENLETPKLLGDAQSAFSNGLVRRRGSPAVLGSQLDPAPIEHAPPQLAAMYAQDPRTGAAVLHLRAEGSDAGKWLQFPMAFTVDSAGVRSLSGTLNVLPGTITTVAPA